MTVPFWCLLAAVTIPYLLAFTGAALRKRELGSVDNRHPRQQVMQLTGTGARCYAAQQNAWEALAVFTAAVVVAHLAGADAGQSAIAALAFMAARILHAVFYLSDHDRLRSLCFVVAMACCVRLFVLAAVAG